MKKFFVTMIIVAAGITSLQAQGYRRAGTSTQVHAMYKDEIKQKLRLSETKAMNVDALMQDYMLKMRAINIATDLSEGERKEKLIALKAERDTKLKTLITERQIAQLDVIYDKPNSKQYPPGEPTADKTEE